MQSIKSVAYNFNKKSAKNLKLKVLKFKTWQLQKDL